MSPKRRIDISALNDDEWHKYLAELEKMPLINRRIMRLSARSQNLSFLSDCVVPEALTETPTEPLSCRATLITLPVKFKCLLALIRPSWGALVEKINTCIRNASALNPPSLVHDAYLDESRLDEHRSPLYVNIIGTPGTGNSLFLFYLVALVLDNDARIPGLIFDSGNKTYILNNNSLMSGFSNEPLSAFRVVWLRKLTLTQANFIPNGWRSYWSVQDGAMTLPYSKVHLRVTSDFMGQERVPKRSFCLYHERWSIEEFACVLRHCLTESTWLDLVKRKIKSVGPIPRDLFTLEPKKVLLPTTDVSQLRQTSFHQYVRNAHWLLWWWPSVANQTGAWTEPLGVCFTSLDLRKRMTQSLETYVREHRNQLLKERAGRLLITYTACFKTERPPPAPQVPFRQEESIEIVDSDSEPEQLASPPIETLQPQRVNSLPSDQMTKLRPDPTSIFDGTPSSREILPVDPPERPLSERRLREPGTPLPPQSYSAVESPISDLFLPTISSMQPSDSPQDIFSTDQAATSTSNVPGNTDSYIADISTLRAAVASSMGNDTPVDSPRVLTEAGVDEEILSPPIDSPTSSPEALFTCTTRDTPLPSPSSPIEDPPPPQASPTQSNSKLDAEGTAVRVGRGSTAKSGAGPSATGARKEDSQNKVATAKQPSATPRRERKRAATPTQKRAPKATKARRTAAADQPVFDSYETACLLTADQRQQVKQVALSVPETANQQELRDVILRSAEHYKELRYQLRMVKSSIAHLLEEWQRETT